MILVAGGVAAEMEQAVLNCEAVAQEFGISLCTCAITFTVYCSENLSADGQQQTEDILQSFLSRNKRCGDSSPMDVEKISTIGHSPLVLYVLVPALPKG
jgi:diphthine-ammonia ligase